MPARRCGSSGVSALLVIILLLPSLGIANTANVAFVLPQSSLASAFPTNRPIFDGVRAAIGHLKNSSLPSPHVVLLPGVHVSSESTDFYLPDGFTLRSALPDETNSPLLATIDCGGALRRAFIIAEASCLIANITVRRCGSYAVRGGAVLIFSIKSRYVVFSGVVFQENYSLVGGAVAIVGDSIIADFNDCLFSSNSASLLGGTVFLIGGVATLKRCTIVNASAPEAAGIMVNAGTVSLVDSHILNSTSLQSSGLSAVSAKVLIVGGSFRNNVATQAGAAGSRLESSECNISGVRFEGNAAADHGGGVVVAGEPIGPQLFKNCTFVDNRTVRKGGAIFLQKSSAVVDACLFVRNEGESGGAIMMAGTQLIMGCSFRENSARDFYGGAIGQENGLLTVSNCKFTANRAKLFGGGVGNQKGKAFVSQSLFMGNTAINGGGAASLTELYVAGSIFNGNVATQLGGAAYFERIGTLTSVLLSSNRAEIAGGGVYQVVGAAVTMSSINYTGNSASYGSDRGSNPASIVLVRAFNSSSRATFNRTSAKPEQLFRLWVRVLDIFGQQASRFYDIPLVVDLMPMKSSGLMGVLTSFASTSLLGGQSQVEMSVAGVIGDTIPLIFTLVASTRMQAMLLVSIDNCSESYDLGFNAKLLHNFPICVPHVVWTKGEVSSALTTAICCATAIVIFMLVLLVVFAFRKSHLPVIQGASPVFLSGFFLWNFVLAAGAPLFSFTPSQLLCLVRTWTFFLGGFGVISLLFIKVWVLRRRLFSQGYRPSISDTQAFVVGCSSNLIMIVVLTAWFSFRPPTPMRMDTGELTYMVTCGEHDRSSWPFLFVALGMLTLVSSASVYVALSVRNAATAFDEAKYALLATCTSFALFVIFVLLVVFTRGKPDSVALLVSLGQLIAAGSLLALIGGQKVWIWKFPPLVVEDSVRVLDASAVTVASSGWTTDTGGAWASAAGT